MKLENMEMQTYLGKLERLIDDYNTLMPFTNDADTFYEERSQFFMVLALVGLAPKLEAVCNKILSSSAIPSYDMVSEQLLCLFTMHAFGSSSAPVEDSFALVPHSSNCGG